MEMNQKVKSVETNKTEGLTLPYMLVWPLRKGDGEATDIAVFIPPSKPIVWILKRVLEGFLLSGRELFFPSQTSPQEISFYRWPLARRLLTNNQRALKEVLYDLGEFELAEKVEQSTLKGMFNLFLPVSLWGGGMGKASAPVNGLWDRIFEVGNVFDGFTVYWIEDRKKPLEETGLSFDKEKGFSKQEINLCEIKKGKKVKCTSLKNINELGEKDWRGFNVLIVDMYFEEESERTISVLGDDIIELVRAEEKKQNELYHNLVIVYTAGSSPFIVSRAKALSADLVVFKGSARGHQGSALEGRFHLFWGIYWPLSVLRYIYNRLGKFNEKPELNRDDFCKLYQEINKLCPPNVFFFWEDWTNEVKESLRNWEMVLTNHPQNSKSKVLIKEVEEKVKDLVKGMKMKPLKRWK